VHGELSDYGLSGAGRRAYQHPMATFERLTGVDLEGIQPERQLPGEVG
jgi:hypothetical protein